MPILKIKIDDEDVEFVISPINKKINNKISEKFIKKENDFLALDRAGYLSYVIKKPKMSRKDWGNVSVSMIDKIIRNINAYIESIDYEEKKLRELHIHISVYEKELDDLYRYMQEDSEDWVWNRIKIIERNIDNLKEEIDKIEKSLDYVKSDYVIYENGKELDFDVQPLQLDQEREE